MTIYNTNLKTWGDVGEEYPDGYNQTGGEPPVDEWHDFLFYNTVKDIKHLVGLTNDRLDSESSAAFPSSPTDGNLVHRSDENLLYYYNTDTSIWAALAKKSTVDNHIGASNNPHNVTAAQAGAIADAVGTVDMSHLSFDPATQADFDGHATSSLNPHGVTAAQVGSYTTAQADSAFAAAGHLHDSRYYTKAYVNGHTGDTTNPHNVTAAQIGAYTEAETRSWVNNSADVPNADYADTAGNAATVGGKTAGELANPASTATESTAASVNFSGSTGYNSSNTKHVSVPNIYVSIIKRTNFTKESNYANFRGFSVRYTNGITWSVDSATAWFPPLGPIDRVSVRGYQSGSQVYDWSAAFDVYSPAITPHDHNL